MNIENNIIEGSNSTDFEADFLELENAPIETLSISEFSPEDKEFYDLLSGVTMENYYLFLKENSVTLNTIKHLTEKDIIDLFGKSVGLRAQFRALVNEYRKINDLPPLNTYTCCCQKRDHAEVNRSKNVESSSSSNALVKAQGNYVFNMDVFLNSNVGNKILQNYKKKNCLTAEERDFLSASIVKCHLENNSSMTLENLNRIAEQICNIFQGEVKKFYFSREPYPRGKLYTKYRALSKAYKKSGIFTNLIRNTVKTQSDRSNEQEAVSEEITIEIFEDDIEWLRHHTSPWTTVESKWKNTYTARKLQIEKQLNSLSQIIKTWPLLRHADAARLIEIDFESKFPDKSNLLFKKFGEIEPNLETLFMNNIKYGPGKEILRKLSPNKESEKKSSTTSIKGENKSSTIKKIKAKETDDDDDDDYEDDDDDTYAKPAPKPPVKKTLVEEVEALLGKKPKDAEEKKSVVPPPPPPPPPSSGIPPPPPPPFAPPSDFERKELSNKQKHTLEKLKSRPRKRPDWSDMMKEVERGKKLKHVECNDRSKPILTISKSVTKVDGQFVFETEKANVHNKLLKQIQSGVKLKPTKCNDRSKPVLEGLRKFRRQMTIEEQIQKSESKAVLNLAAVPNEVPEDSPDEMDDIDKLRDDLQSTKQMLALELRNKEAQERENKRLLAKIANLEAELANKGGGSGESGGGGNVDDKLVKQYKKDAEDARKETKTVEKKYNDTAEKLDVAKGQVEEQRRKIAELEKKLMQAVQGHYKNSNGSTNKLKSQFSYCDDDNYEYNSNSNYQGIIPSSSNLRRQSTVIGKESSPELELEESEDNEDDTEEEKEARKVRRLEREIIFLRTKLTKLLDKEMAAKKEKANIKEAMKKNQTLLKQETKKLKKLEKEVAKMAATMTLDEEDEENGLEEKDEPQEDEKDETESEESESESEEETESESEESEPEDASNEKKKSNLEPRVKKHEGRLTALKKTNFLLQTNVDRLQDEINITREKAGDLQQELDAVLAGF